MAKAYFVDQHAVLRQIWGKSDTILLVFAGAAAEFALSKAVDWLYFTGKLPADPLGRLFSTISYAKSIVFAEKQHAISTIDAITKIHAGVEAKRGASIPDWAYRDVLFMLIDYSIRAFELMERKLSSSEKAEVFDVFYCIGARMGIKDLPTNFDEFTIRREQQLEQNLVNSKYTIDLFLQYRKHLGMLRFQILLEVQKILVPKKVRELLGLRNFSLLYPALKIYKLSKILKLEWLVLKFILPAKYKNLIPNLNSFGEKPNILKQATDKMYAPDCLVNNVSPNVCSQVIN